jgi:hypothetical protein
LSASQLLNAIHERLGRIEAKLDAREREFSGVSRRVRVLEARWSKLMGAAACVAFPFTLAWSYFKARKH